MGRKTPAGEMGARRAGAERRIHMKIMILFVGWCILLVLCWPLALAALVLAPLIWLLSLPIRLVVLCVEAALGLLRGLLLLPGRLLAGRTRA